MDEHEVFDEMNRSQLGAEFTADEVEVRNSEPLPLMRRVEAEYVTMFGTDPVDRRGWYEPDGWKRISRVLERLELGGDILDVGTGAGQFVNCLALSGCFNSVTTADPTRFKKYIELSEAFTRLNRSVVKMGFDDDSFDVVTCMEVLEHLPEEILLPAIDELRRVCRGQLIITVPYREPPPISKTHLRRFEDEDLIRLFPSARFTILRRPQKPWVLIEELHNGHTPPRLRPLVQELGLHRERLDLLSRENSIMKNRKSIRAANWLGHQFRTLVAPIKRSS